MDLKRTKWIAGGLLLAVRGAFAVLFVRDEGPKVRLGFAGISRDQTMVWAVVTIRNEGSRAVVVRGYAANQPFYYIQEKAEGKWGESRALSWCGTGVGWHEVGARSETPFQAWIWSTNKWEGRFGVRYSRSSMWDKIPYEVKRYFPIFAEKETAMAWSEPIVFEPT